MEDTDFLKPFFRASETLSQWDWDGVEVAPQSIDSSAYEALRVESFKLESLGRVLRRTSKKEPELRELGGHLKESAKIIEDTLGRYLFIIEVSEAAKHQRRKEVILPELGKHLKTACDSLSDRAHLCLGACYEIETLMEALKLKSGGLKELYLKGLTKNISRIQKKIKGIDSEALEDGTHELRRQLRWAIMGVVYASDLFYFGKTESLGGQKKYLEVSGSQKKGSLFLEADPLIGLSQRVGMLGKVKDKGLEKHFFSSLVSTNRSVNINKSFLEAMKVTEEALEYCRSQRPLENLIQQIKSQV